MTGHHHPLPTTPVEDRVAALEALLVDKGILDPAAMDAVVEHYEHAVGPMNGAKVVARAWVDAGLPGAAARRRHRGDRRARVLRPRGRPHGRRREHARGAQRGRVHAVLVLPVAGAWAAAELVQEPAVPLPHGPRAAGCSWPRWGARSPSDCEIRVWDSSAEVRYLVLPMRPAATDGLSQGELAELVTRDAMIGVARLVTEPERTRRRARGGLAAAIERRAGVRCPLASAGACPGGALGRGHGPALGRLPPSPHRRHRRGRRTAVLGQLGVRPRRLRGRVRDRRLRTAGSAKRGAGHGIAPDLQRGRRPARRQAGHPPRRLRLHRRRRRGRGHHARERGRLPGPVVPSPHGRRRAGPGPGHDHLRHPSVDARRAGPVRPGPADARRRRYRSGPRRRRRRARLGAFHRGRDRPRGGGRGLERAEVVPALQAR